MLNVLTPDLIISLLTNPKASAWLGTNPKIDPVLFYHELLLTYRLLFESDHYASAQFHRLMPSWQDSLYGSLPAVANASPFLNTHKRMVPDPLLPILCGSYHDAAIPSALYEALDAAPLSANNNYNALNFPFLGTRLLELQEHVMSRNANTLAGLWHDKRVASNWYTLWVCLRPYEMR